VNEIHLAITAMFISDQPATDEQFEAFLDAVVTQLDNIGREVNLAARLRDRVAEFATAIPANDFPSAASTFLGDLRTALHAVGCVTADWPRFEASEHVVRELLDA
jgi:hypothetical protein